MQWACGICGYIHEEDELPQTCPVCGAPESKFSEWHGTDPKDLLSDKKFRDDDDDHFERDLFGDLEE